MTAPVPSTGTQDLAERVAAARQQIAHEGTGYIPAWDGLAPHEQKMAVLDAANWMKAIQAAGLVVVELPGPDPDAAAHPTWLDGDGRSWHAQPGGVVNDYGDLCDVDEIRRTAAALLAACDAVERLRAEHGGEKP